MKVFISADIEGVNNICTWDETDNRSGEYQYFRKQMTEEVAAACRAAKEAGATEIFVKDAHDSARNLILKDLPEYVKLHRGWEGVPCSMMAGLNESFDAVMFIGYHSPASSEGNPLSHTMNLRNQYVKINGILTSEFYINALYASYLGVPVAFLSGDKELTRIVKEANEFIEANDPEELADLMEVVYAIATLKNIDLKNVEEIRKQKALKRCAFNKKIFLKSVERKGE